MTLDVLLRHKINVYKICESHKVNVKLPYSLVIYFLVYCCIDSILWASIDCRSEHLTVDLTTLMRTTSIHL